MTQTHEPSDVGSGMSTVLALWRDAQAHGWTVTADPTTGGWHAYTGDRTAGTTYRPPSEATTGAVTAYDAYRTMTWTGVAGPQEAVVLTRSFFGWPAPTKGCP